MGDVSLEIGFWWRYTFRCLVLGVMAVLLGVSPAKAQKPESERKPIYKVNPQYPPDLKRNGIGGIVRLSIVVTPGGNVTKVSPIGGNAALVDAATVAVKQWKYAPGDTNSTLEVQFDFVPSR